jgi:hypothetical protein
MWPPTPLRKRRKSQVITCSSIAPPTLAGNSCSHEPQAGLYQKMFQQSIDDVNPRLIPTLVVFLGNCYSWMGCGWSQLSQLIKIKEEKKQQLCNYFESGPARLTRNHFGLVSLVKKSSALPFYFCLKALFTSYKHTLS